MSLKQLSLSDSKQVDILKYNLSLRILPRVLLPDQSNSIVLLVMRCLLSS